MEPQAQLGVSEAVCSPSYDGYGNIYPSNKGKKLHKNNNSLVRNLALTDYLERIPIDCVFPSLKSHTSAVSHQVKIKTKNDPKQWVWVAFFCCINAVKGPFQLPTPETLPQIPPAPLGSTVFQSLNGKLCWVGPCLTAICEVKPGATQPPETKSCLHCLCCPLGINDLSHN